MTRSLTRFPRVAAVLLAGAAIMISCEPTTQPREATRQSPAFLVAGSGLWTAKSSMPTARDFFGAGVIGGILYAAGGRTGTQQALATVEAYDPATNTWTTEGSMPVARAGMGTDVVNGLLYVVGGHGSDGFAVATVEVYDPTTDTWTTKASMPTPRQGLGTGVVDGLLYAIGGENFGYQVAVEVYDPSADAWTTKAPLPFPANSPGVSVIKGILYVVGGVGNNGLPLATVEAYDPSTNTWTPKASMSTPRSAPGVAEIHNILYAVGGSAPTGPLATIEAYDPFTDTWTTEASMPTARSYLSGAGINGMVYAVGGNNNGPLATVEVFAPLFYVFTGFFQPVDNPAVVNTVKAGSAIPVKFSLGGDQGLDIFATGFPGSRSYTCTGGSEDTIEQTAAAGSSSLSYDATTRQYTYVWKTDRLWAGTCRRLVVGLTDGSVHEALFRFSK